MQWRMFDLPSCLGEEGGVLLLLSFPTPYKPNKQRKWVYYWLQVIFIDLNDNNLPLFLSSSIVQQLRTVIFFNSVTPESNITVTRIKEGIANSKSSWLADEFSLEVTWNVERTVWRTCILMLGCTWMSRSLDKNNRLCALPALSIIGISGTRWRQKSVLEPSCDWIDTSYAKPTALPHSIFPSMSFV